MSLRKVVCLASGVLSVVMVLVHLSPWTAAPVAHALKIQRGLAQNEALAPLVPLGSHAILDIAYSASSPRNRLDVFHPPDTCSSRSLLPTVVWVHGSGSAVGDKSHIANYLRILAAKGYTVVAVGYERPPGAAFLEPVH